MPDTLGFVPPRFASSAANRRTHIASAKPVPHNSEPVDPGLLGICAPRDLPEFTAAGFLPEGLHEAPLSAIKSRLVTNPRRSQLWNQMLEFLLWAITSNGFSHVYLGGGFASTQEYPDDVDLVLQVRHPFGTKAFTVIEPFFRLGLEKILDIYSVHLHFWVEGLPNGSDFRAFFQYVHPRDLRAQSLSGGSKKGVIRIALNRDMIPTLPGLLVR